MVRIKKVICNHTVQIQAHLHGDKDKKTRLTVNKCIVDVNSPALEWENSYPLNLDMWC